VNEEIEVLESQLEELLEEGCVDPEDALEVALVAGVASRVGIDPELMAEAEAWRDGAGRELLGEAFSLLDVEEILAEFDAVLDGMSTDEVVEDAILDLDELIAAAIWGGHRGAVSEVSAHATQSVKMMPELFGHLVEEGARMANQPAVGADYDLYGYWIEIASQG